MRDDYVWDMSGDAEPDLVAFERTLSMLRQRAPMVELPAQSFVPTSKTTRRPWARPIVLGALLSSTLTVLLIWGFLRVWPMPVETVIEVDDAVSVAAPPRRTRRADERERLARLETLVADLQVSLDHLDAAVEELIAANEAAEERHKAEAAARARRDRHDEIAEDLERVQQDVERNRKVAEGLEAVLAEEASMKDKLTSSDIKEGIAPHKGAAKRCGAKYGGEPGERVAIKLSISGATGRVTQSVATGVHKGTPLGNCVAAALGKAVFPRFKRASLGVLYPIRL